MWNSAKPEDAGVNFLRSDKKNTYCEGVQPIRALGTKEVVSNIELGLCARVEGVCIGQDDKSELKAARILCSL